MKKSIRALGDKFKSIDSLGPSIQFKIDGSSSHKTYIGSIVSLWIYFIMLSYIFRRLDVMLRYTDTNH